MEFSSPLDVQHWSFVFILVFISLCCRRGLFYDLLELRRQQSTILNSQSSSNLIFCASLLFVMVASTIAVVTRATDLRECFHDDKVDTLGQGGVVEGRSK